MLQNSVTLIFYCFLNSSISKGTILYNTLSSVAGNNFTVNVGASPDTSTHHFKSATAGITRSVVKIGGAYTHTAVPADFAANGVKK